MTRYILIALLAMPTALPAQDSAVVDAVLRGTRAKSCDLTIKTARPFGRATGFTVVVTGPLNRVECLAASRAKKYLAFSPESVSVDMTAEFLEIDAQPLKPVLTSSGWSITPPATHLVLFLGEGEGVDPIQPDSVWLDDVDWTNAAGGKFQGKSVGARFALKGIPKEGELTIAVVTSEREYRTKIGKSDRKKIR